MEWKAFVVDYISKTETMILRTRRDIIRCPECRMNVSKDVFLAHRTERGCDKLDPKLALGSWDIEQYF